MIRTVATMPGVDSARIGVVTFSYGIKMDSGALVRYTDLPIRFLIDWKGPASRIYLTGGCPRAQADSHCKNWINLTHIAALV